MSGLNFGSDSSGFSSNKRRSGSDWASSSTAADNAGSSLSKSLYRAGNTGNQTFGAGAANFTESSSTPKPFLSSSRSVQGNLSGFSQPNALAGQENNANGGQFGSNSGASAKNGLILTNTPDRQFDEKSRQSFGRRNVVSNISSLSGYGSATKASSFAQHTTEARNGSSGSNASTTKNRLFRQPSFAEKPESPLPNSSFRGNMSSFGSRKSLGSKRSMLLREDDIPPSLSMYDLPRSPERSALRDESAIETAKPPQLDVTQHSVIVFGYPEAFTRAVIEHFGKFGRVLEQMAAIPDSQKVPSGEYQQAPVLIGPNWVKLTYEDPRAARRALEENGTLFSRCYALGVLAVTPEVLKRYEAAAQYEMKNLPDARENERIMATLANIAPDASLMSEQASMNEDTSSILPRSSILRANGEKSIPRTISMPVLGPKDDAKKMKLQHGKSIYPQRKKMKFMPSLSNIQQELEPSKDRDGEAGDKSWLGWTSKRARELVFGWDDI